MKKLFLSILVCCVISNIVIAQQKWTDNLRLEADIGLGLAANKFEIRSAYMFPFAKIFIFDAGIDFFVNTNSPFLALDKDASGEYATLDLTSFNINPFISLWVWNFYITSAIGVCFNKAGVDPTFMDIRLGWQPRFMQKERGLCFKTETGVAQLAGLNKWTHVEKNEETGEVTKEKKSGSDIWIDVFITLGVSYRF